MHILNNPKRVYDKKSTLLDIIKIELLLWKCKRIYKKYPHFIDEEYNMKKVLCAYCMELVEYDIEERPAIKRIRDKDYSYNELRTYCKECHKEINVGKVIDENIDRINKVYYDEV